MSTCVGLGIPLEGAKEEFTIVDAASVVASLMGINHGTDNSLNGGEVEVEGSVPQSFIFKEEMPQGQETSDMGADEGES